MRRTTRWLGSVCAMVAMLGCGPDSGTAETDDDPPMDDDPDGDGGVDLPPDAAEPCDRAVCFFWRGPPPPPPPPVPGTVAEIRYEECNSYGQRPGVCPDGFTCGPREEFSVPPLFEVSTPVCNSDRSPPVRELDIELVPVALDTVAVQLDLRLGGEPWPDGSAALARAGTLRVYDPTDGRRTWTFDVPARGDHLTIDVPVGRYDVDLRLDDREGRTFPSASLRAALVVQRAGADTVDVAIARLRFALRLDGVEVAAVPASSTVHVSLASDTASLSRRFAAGARPAGTVVVTPGRYDASVQTYSADPASFPEGAIITATDLVVDAGDDGVVPVDAATVTTIATVTVDGRDIPGAQNSGFVSFRSDGATSSVPIGAARPAQVRARLFVGTYDVGLDTSSTIFLDGVPRGAAIVRRGWVASRTVALAATTVEVSGSVRRNGVPAPAATDDSYVAFTGEVGSTEIPLRDEAGASYQGRVYTGSYDVSVRGDGARLPAAAVPVARDWPASPGARVWDLRAHRLRVTLTHNGQVPPDAPASRASLMAVATIDHQSVDVRQAFPATGPMRVDVLVPDATWTLTALTASGYSGLPEGYLPGGSVVVERADASHTTDVQSIRITGDVTLAGRALPTVGTAGDRGWISLSSVFYGSTFQASIALPVSGPARYSVLVIPGVHDISYGCYTEGCRAVALPTAVTTYRAIRLR